MVLDAPVVSRRHIVGLLSVGLVAACAPRSAEGKAVVVYEDPNCGCCGGWVSHMKRAGFPVTVVEQPDLTVVRARYGVPEAAASCHTAVVEGYFIEGHVPPEDVRRLLATRPAARGLAVPGMPSGSPGMDAPDGRVGPYAVLLVLQDGSSSVFARHA